MNTIFFDKWSNMFTSRMVLGIQLHVIHVIMVQVCCSKQFLPKCLWYLGMWVEASRYLYKSLLIIYRLSYASIFLYHEHFSLTCLKKSILYEHARLNEQFNVNIFLLHHGHRRPLHSDNDDLRSLMEVKGHWSIYVKIRFFFLSRIFMVLQRYN